MIVLSYVASITLMLMELADKENNLYIMLMAQCTYTIDGITACTQLSFFIKWENYSKEESMHLNATSLL